MLSSPAVRSSQLSRAVLDTEVVLADSARVPIDYQADYRFVPTPRWYTDFDVVNPTDPTQDVSVAAGAAGVTVQLPGYPTGNQPLPSNVKPKPDTIFVSSSDLAGATTYQEWFQEPTDNSHGYTIEMLSRKVLAELDGRGWAIVRYRYTDGSLSDPLKLYVINHISGPVDVSGVTKTLPLLDLGGGFAKQHLPKPKSDKAVKALYDPTDKNAGAINEVQVVDDPEYPFMSGIVGGPELFQADVPGTVFDASTGEGVAGATVTLVGSAVSATSWPGGAFDLPAFSQPFASMHVSVQAPGYETLTTTVDLAKRGAVPLHLSLRPVPVGATWVDRADLDSTLSRLHLSDRSRFLIRQAITQDPAISVLVPAQPVLDAIGPIDGWLQVNGHTGEMFPMLEDGLYGTSSLRDVTGAIGGFVTGAAKKGAGWATGKAKDWVNEQIEKPFDAPHTTVGAPISFFAGHIAGWYLFAAGALTAVSVNMSNPSLTMCQFHQITVSTAVALVKGGWVRTGVNFGLKQALKKAGYPGFPFLNGRLYSKAMQYGALSAIHALALLTKHEWGLAGTSC